MKFKVIFIFLGIFVSIVNSSICQTSNDIKRRRVNQIERGNSYDNSSNRISYSITPNGIQQTENYTTYNTTNQIESAISNDETTTFEYDSRGNRSKEIINGVVVREFKYDDFDNLIEVKMGDKVYKYAYDYRGRRIIADETGAGGKYKINTFSNETIITEYEADIQDENQNITRLYYRGLDMGGGVGGINYSTKSDGSNPQYYHYNMRGDIITKTNHVGNITFLAQYEAFGECTEIMSNPDDNSRHRANTKESDPTRLINDGRRYRDPKTGVFLTPDPLEYVDGLNLYTYCSNNPWSRFDAHGLNAYPIVWFTTNNSFGHSGIAFDNYKIEKIIDFDDRGKRVVHNIKVPDGTVTYYDLWPGNEAGVGMRNASEEVKAYYNAAVVLNKKDLVNFIPDGAEKSADAIIELRTSYSQDQKMESLIKKEVKESKEYVGTDNNCSTLVQNAIKEVYKEFSSEENIPFKVKIKTGIKLPWSINIATPNKLYNEAMNLPNSSIFKGPTQKVESSHKSSGIQDDTINK